ncbi:mitochondrial genome maintenance exonuclease 1 isoform X1 [Phyllopteryx taeniolatus]|uniref:mitochondrial genome maintenance exonuclease 1 isoform X1 n=1 Tax=Phyllopteryx taeniolatus TaxID=161469 RepID=UPI002AD3FF4E|nr:mitochondrial genome maintenance exonuclease 1 isoform X1 [Phyllopteryx taeniolatus]XP_061646147.1 mitochondrial genome maintenance exonuclease 1 isoform X2 [Phyllopteryx taeniolatus]XP_061646148.1 mitochondrial genome maintenance exonuclease 1 isoform X1 [Phyllopteryx taeniolatus]
MFIFKRAPFAGGFRMLQYTSLTFGFCIACHRSSSRRGASPYNSVDSERYSSLVKSVMSSRVSSQTPETIQAEDEHMFGPVVKVQTTSRQATRLPKVMYPFSHCEDTPETEDLESVPPVRIVLNRDRDRSSIPSVTRILQATLSPEQLFFLERWKRKMVAELGEEGFKDYTKNLFRQGKLFHSALEEVLMSFATREDDQHAPDVLGYMKSIAYILEDVSAARAIESSVRHDTLNYLGIVDCVARYRGVLCIIDWKTSEKRKPFLSNTYDNPIQVAAYAGALNGDDRYKYQVENGLIVVAYKDGSPAHAHQLNHELMLEYWEKWLIRLEEFQEQRR